MKKFLTLIIIAAATFAAAPKADARPHHPGHTYVSGRTSCGCPVYSQRFIAYYDHCGHPVYSVRTLPVTHRCRRVVHHQPQYCPPPHASQRRVWHHSRGASYNSSYRPGYYSSGGYSSNGRCR